MNCSEVIERLSELYDNELAQDEAANVRAHVADCSSCANELVSFKQLSRLSRRLSDPLTPTGLWDELQMNLEGATDSKKSLLPVQPNPISGRLLVPGRLLVLAATVLVAVGVGVFTYQTHFSHEQNNIAVDFSEYLEDFSERPDAAQQILTVNYDGRLISLNEAAAVLGYTPVAAHGFPPGYSLKEVYLLKMPCCKCTQVICTNKAGKSIAIFEHDIAQPVWFGDRPNVKYLYHEVPTNVIQMGDRLAATWKAGERHITIIGAMDLNEVTTLVAHLKKVPRQKNLWVDLW